MKVHLMVLGSGFAIGQPAGAPAEEEEAAVGGATVYQGEDGVYQGEDGTYQGGGD